MYSLQNYGNSCEYPSDPVYFLATCLSHCEERSNLILVGLLLVAYSCGKRIVICRSNFSKLYSPVFIDYWDGYEVRDFAEQSRLYFVVTIYSYFAELAIIYLLLVVGTVCKTALTKVDI